MISGQNIVCISNTTWYGPFTKSTVQLMSRMAVGNRLVFVEYPFTIKDVLLTLLKRGKAPVSRILGIKNRIREIRTDQNSVIYQLVVPPVLPCDFIKNEILFHVIFNINTKIYLRCLRKALKKLNMENVISVSAYNPYYGLKLRHKLNEILNIYYSYDGPNIRRHGKRVMKIDNEYSSIADAVITTSAFLAEEKKKHNPNCFVVKNGVDFEAFNKFSKVETSRQKTPKIGYIGSMDFRFDIDMVEAAVKALPFYEFHFIGHVRNKTITSRLVSFSNVSFFPPVKPAEVPALLSGFSAGIIPYLQNEINKNIYPLKINEYLAVGVPVIMSKFADLPEFEEMADSVTNPADFIRRIKDLVEEDDSAKRIQRIEFASKNSWDKRAEEFSGIIEGLLNESKSV